MNVSILARVIFQHMFISSVAPSSHVLVMTPAKVEIFNGSADVFRP